MFALLRSYILLSLTIITASSAIQADIRLPERRKDQFPTDPGYYLVPTPYSIPGIGAGFIIVGAMTNISQTHADMYGFAATGDIKGYGLFGTQIHLLEKQLIFDFSVTSFNKATSQVYGQRGMNSSADDFVYADLDYINFKGTRLTYTMYDRRLEFYGILFSNESKLAAIRDSDGNLIQVAVDSEPVETESYSFGFRLDLTDDYIDPRRGVRVESSLWHTPPSNDEAADFDIIELNLSGYLPMRSRDTLVLNYFQADSRVNRQGQTDPSIVEDDLGLDCSTGSPQDQMNCLSIVNNTVAENTYGSVGALGGLSRLRSYPENRFKGSHSIFFGIEYRWNLVEETKPFDYFFAKDIRSVVQLAAFYERGAISDDRDDLWGSMRDSYGIGARLVTKSGLVFRADIATGDEGEEISFIFGYPWEVF